MGDKIDAVVVIPVAAVMYLRSGLCFAAFCRLASSEDEEDDGDSNDERGVLPTDCQARTEFVKNRIPPQEQLMREYIRVDSCQRNALAISFVGLFFNLRIEVVELACYDAPARRSIILNTSAGKFNFALLYAFFVHRPGFLSFELMALSAQWQFLIISRSCMHSFVLAVHVSI